MYFKPGLVGGHCIGVDPYYLAHKALSIGYNPEMILSGRRINDSMGEFVAEKFIKLLINNNILIKNSKILILGITFKENCPDIRNMVKSVIDKLLNYGVDISVYDPLASSQEVKSNYKIELIEKPVNNNYDGIMIAVAHKEFYKLDIDKLKKNKQSIIFDVKGIKNNSDYKL